MDFKGTIESINIDLATRTAIITIKTKQIDGFMERFSKLINKAKNIKITDLKRSTDANSYYWTLCSKLSAKLGIEATELYREMISRAVGDNFEYDVIMDKQYKASVEDWESRGVGWSVEPVQVVTVDYVHNGKPLKANGKMVLKYYGSSKFDKSQMNRLIDECIAECKEQGIETDTPEELAKQKASWGLNYGRI